MWDEVVPSGAGFLWTWNVFLAVVVVVSPVSRPYAMSEL